MSNPESFIDEVTEEVRRDRLYATFRRWGWIPILLVVLIVGGTVWTEWRKSQAAAQSAAFGDALLSAISAEDGGDRLADLAAVPAGGPAQAAILSLIQASASNAGEDAAPDLARARLLELAEMADLAPIYRDLALLKAMLMGGTGDAGRDAAILEELATPGAPFRALAIEQQAVLAIRAGDTGTAVTLLRVLTEEAGVTESLRRRAQQVIVTLGASPDPA